MRQSGLGFLHRVIFVLFADMLVNGMAALAVGLIVYLGWLSFRQWQERRAEQKGRKKNRRGHWGYE